MKRMFKQNFSWLRASVLVLLAISLVMGGIPLVMPINQGRASSLTITSTNPTKDEKIVDTNKTIAITFSDDIEPGAAYNDIKLLHLTYQPMTDVIKTIVGNTLYLKPGNGFTWAKYRVVIPPSAVQSKAGTPSPSYYFDFTVRSEGMPEKSLYLESAGLYRAYKDYGSYYREDMQYSIKRRFSTTQGKNLKLYWDISTNKGSYHWLFLNILPDSNIGEQGSEIIPPEFCGYNLGWDYNLEFYSVDLTVEGPDGTEVIPLPVPQRNYGPWLFSMHYFDLGSPNNKTPIILIPGIMGTELWKEQEKTNKIWPPGKYGDSSEGWGDLISDFLTLSMTTDGFSVNNLYVGDPVADYYKFLHDSLEEAGYKVYYFGYDWRLDNDANAANLRLFINSLNTSKASIVAHSMGGLVASRYIAQCRQMGFDNKVDKLITLGTPYLGTPGALEKIETGKIAEEIPKIDYVLDKIKEFAANVPSAHQLLPPQTYFDYANKYYVKTKVTDYQGTSNNSLTSYSDTNKFFRDYSRPWLREQQRFDSDFLNRSLDLLKTVQADNTYIIVGDNQKTTGIVNCICTQDTAFGFGPVFRGIDVDQLNGDGTVVLASATVGDQIKNGHVYYFSMEHMKLARDGSVIYQIKNILSGHPDILAPGCQKVPHKSETLKIKVECPVELHVYDSQGNHMGPSPDMSIDEGIAGGSYHPLGDTKVALLPVDNYNVKLIGIGDGAMTYTLQWYDENDAKEKIIRFDNVKVTPTTVITTNTEGPIALSVDENGDNIVDKTIEPSVVLDAVGSNDETPPVITLNAPTDGAEYLLNQNVAANWSTEDLESGILSANGTTANGKSIDTKSVGAKNYMITATDKALNMATKTTNYFVHYRYSGILQPINANGSSIFKLGSTVPVKFQLSDYFGILLPDYMANNVVARIYVSKITAGVLGSEAEAISASSEMAGNLFRYDPIAKQFIFNLGTKALSTGTWQIRIELDDGSSRDATISLK